MRFPLLTLLALFLPLLAGAAECPKGDHEASLTLSRVMRNFGRFTMIADSVAINGLQNPASIGDSDIQNAIDKLVLAEACAAAVVADRDESLLPQKAGDLHGADRDAYIKLLRDTMQDFADGLRAYQGVYQDLLAAPPALRSFEKAKKWADEIDARATRAHALLQ
ncbi:MAG: hypothetical protein ACXVB9_19430 [Bdellovibrionota bacterium]